MLFENFEKVFSTYIHTEFTILGQVLSFFSLVLFQNVRIQRVSLQSREIRQE